MVGRFPLIPSLKRMTVMATATIDFEQETKNAQAEYRAAVVSAAKGKADLQRVREVCLLAGVPMSTFQKHSDRMRSRLDALEQMAEAERLIQAIANAQSDMEAAGSALAKARQKAQEIIGKATGPVEEAQRRQQELAARRQLLLNDARGVLNRTRDLEVDHKIGRLNTEKQNLQGRADNFGVPLRVQGQKLERLQQRLADREDDPNGERERILLQSEIAGVERRIKQLSAEQSTAAAVVAERLPEIQREIARLEASRLEPETMNWS